jgi:hypothetical protein
MPEVAAPPATPPKSPTPPKPGAIARVFGQQADVPAAADSPHPDAIAAAPPGQRLHPNVTKVKTPDGASWVIKGRANKRAAVQTEVAASSLAPLAGVNVPRVHHITIRGQDHAAVPHVAGTDLTTMSPDARRAALSAVPKPDLDRHALFDYLIGSADPNNGNYLVAPGNKFVAIDK